MLQLCPLTSTFWLLALCVIFDDNRRDTTTAYAVVLVVRFALHALCCLAICRVNTDWLHEAML